MHPVTFSMKRVFLRSVHITKDWMALYYLTPARFDMMTAIGSRPEGIGQSTLRAILGVSSPTVSRMLKSLHLLGYVRREIDPDDRRRRWLSLTPDGAAWLHVIHQDMTYGPFGELATRQMISPNWEDRTNTEIAMANARAFFGTVRELLADSACLRYPGHEASGERSADYPVPYYSDRLSNPLDPAYVGPS